MALTSACQTKYMWYSHQRPESSMESSDSLCRLNCQVVGADHFFQEIQGICEAFVVLGQLVHGASSFLYDRRATSLCGVPVPQNHNILSRFGHIGDGA